MPASLKWSRRLSPILLPALAALSASCDVAPEAQTTSPATASSVDSSETILLASATTPQGTELRFFETSPGTMLITERGTLVNPPQGSQIRELPARAVDIYKRLVPGSEPPVALLEAQARLDEMKQDHSGLKPIRPRPDPALPQDNGIAETRLALEDASPNDSLIPSSWFVANKCPNQSAVKKACLVRRSGDETFTTDDVHFLDANMASYRGTIRVKVRQRTWWSWSTKNEFSVAPGEVWWASWNSGFGDADVALDFRDAAGDGYHYFAAAYNGLRTYN